MPRRSYPFWRDREPRTSPTPDSSTTAWTATWWRRWGLAILTISASSPCCIRKRGTSWRWETLGNAVMDHRNWGDWLYQQRLHVHVNDAEASADTTDADEVEQQFDFRRVSVSSAPVKIERLDLMLSARQWTTVLRMTNRAAAAKVAVEFEWATGRTLECGLVGRADRGLRVLDQGWSADPCGDRRGWNVEEAGRHGCLQPLGRRTAAGPGCHVARQRTCGLDDAAGLQRQRPRPVGQRSTGGGQRRATEDFSGSPRRSASAR